MSSAPIGWGGEVKQRRADHRNLRLRDAGAIADDLYEALRGRVALPPDERRGASGDSVDYSVYGPVTQGFRRDSCAEHGVQCQIPCVPQKPPESREKLLATPIGELAECWLGVRCTDGCKSKRVFASEADGGAAE